MNQTTCVVCDADVAPILDLKTQALANNLIAQPDEAFEAFPLGLAACEGCGHAQLTHFVDPADLFKDYLYASGTSQTLKAFFDWFADALVAAVGPGSSVLELACNDGSLLDSMAARGLRVTGVDPAANLTHIASGKGHDVLTGFFPQTTPDGTFDAIVAMNVAAHTPDPQAFMAGIAASLKEEGVAIIQTSQAMMIANGEFDTIYHEHYSFYSASSMARLAERAGLVLEQTQLVSVHGTSFLFFLRRRGASRPISFPLSAPFAVAWPQPVPAPLGEDFTGTRAKTSFHDFASKADALMRTVKATVDEHRASGRDVALIGVAAKALTFVRAAQIAPDWYFDEAPLKVGRFVPGATTAIRPLGDLAKLPRETVLLIGAWNFADELMRKIDALRLPLDHRYLVHLPRLREVAYRSAECVS
jgi:SAM-dependent methyltransferase